MRWNPLIRCDAPHTRPDLLLSIPGKRKTFILEVTVCQDSYVGRRHEEKKQRYLKLADEIGAATNSSVEILVFAIGITGAVCKEIHKDLKKLQDFGIDIRLSKLQRIAAEGSARLIRKILAR